MPEFDHKAFEDRIERFIKEYSAAKGQTAEFQVLDYFTDEAIEMLRACFNELDGLSSDNGNLHLEVILLRRKAEDGYRRGLEDAADFTRDYWYRGGTLAGYPKAIRALMDTPQETGEEDGDG